MSNFYGNQMLSFKDDDQTELRSQTEHIDENIEVEISLFPRKGLLINFEEPDIQETIVFLSTEYPKERFVHMAEG